MKENSVESLPKLIKDARELSVLGGYHKSLETYKKIFQIIEERMQEVKDDFNLSEKWQEAKDKLKYECTLIFKIYQNCKIFQMDEIENNIKQAEEEKYNNNILLRDSKKVKKKENSKRWEHFGGKPPFSYLKDKKEEEDNIELSIKQKFNYKSENLNKNYVVDKPYYNSNYNNNYYVNTEKTNYTNVNYLDGFYDDPDVWTSPEEDPRFPYQKSKSNHIINTKKRPITHKNTVDLGVVNEKNVEKRRQNYERPWAVPPSAKPKDKEKNIKSSKTLPRKKNGNNKDNKKINKGPPKSPFLLNRYPEDEGYGPDTDLIEMVEREVVDMNPNVSFDDIAELETAKRALTEAVVLPLLMPDFFVGLRRPWKGVLLYGPPGTGKTLLAKALATQGKTTFFNVSPTTFASKWKGESEKLVRILFEMARFYAPSTIFIDEVDSVGTKRTDGENEASKKVLAEMLVQMDGISELNSGKKENNDINGTEEIKPKFVMVLGATNMPWDLDDALRRRFEKRIYIPLPNKVGREQMFHINFKGINLSNDVNIDTLVQKTEGYSGHDISSVCREASLMNMRKKLMNENGTMDILQMANNKENFLSDLEAPVSQNDILIAIKNISKSVSSNDVKKFEDWTKMFASN
jgi:katanin p60 ATPase-containing subunit A1